MTVISCVTGPAGRRGGASGDHDAGYGGDGGDVGRQQEDGERS